VFPPQVVVREDNRGRQERRSIAVRPVTPEQLGLAGARQLAQVQRTRAGAGSAFVAESLRDPTALAAKLVAPTDALAQSLRAALSAKARRALDPGTQVPLEPATPAALVRGLNKLAKGIALYDPARFPASVLSPETRSFRAKHPQPKGAKLATLNRLLLCDAFPAELSARPGPETDWLATSRAPAQLGAEQLLQANRQYWGIENGTHQRLDCSAFEDRLRIRDHPTVAVLGFLHRVSISLFVAWAKTQREPRDRTFPTWQDYHRAHPWSMIRQVTQAPA